MTQTHFKFNTKSTLVYHQRLVKIKLSSVRTSIQSFDKIYLLIIPVCWHSAAIIYQMLCQY